MLCQPVAMRPEAGSNQYQEPPSFCQPVALAPSEPNQYQEPSAA